MLVLQLSKASPDWHVGYRMISSVLALLIVLISACGESEYREELGRKVESIVISEGIYTESILDVKNVSNSSSVIEKGSAEKGAKNTIYKIPISAVFADREGYERQYVWIVNPGSMRVNQREVEVKRYSASGAEITRGLKEGEHIVLSDVHNLNEGDLVNVTSNM